MIYKGYKISVSWCIKGLKNIPAYTKSHPTLPPLKSNGFPFGVDLFLGILKPSDEERPFMQNKQTGPDGP